MLLHDFTDPQTAVDVDCACVTEIVYYFVFNYWMLCLASALVTPSRHSSWKLLRIFYKNRNLLHFNLVPTDLLHTALFAVLSELTSKLGGFLLKILFIRHSKYQTCFLKICLQSRHYFSWNVKLLVSITGLFKLFLKHEIPFRHCKAWIWTLSC